MYQEITFEPLSEQEQVKVSWKKFTVGKFFSIGGFFLTAVLCFEWYLDLESLFDLIFNINIHPFSLFTTIGLIMVGKYIYSGYLNAKSKRKKIIYSTLKEVVIGDIYSGTDIKLNHQLGPKKIVIYGEEGIDPNRLKYGTLYRIELTEFGHQVLNIEEVDV